MKLRASGYIMKPVLPDQIKEEIENLRYLPAPGALYVRCFGSFEVIANGKPLRFPRTKCKELLAYLIDRKGAVASTGDIIGVLWENEPINQSVLSQVRTIFSQLCVVLKAAGADQWIVKDRNSFAINPDKIPCDYFDF